ARLALAALFPLALAGAAKAQECPGWTTGFEYPGTTGLVRALADYDDGRGSALYAAGDFGGAGPIRATRIARWDGTTWENLGGGIDGPVTSLAVYDDGGGPALYAGGNFLRAGGLAARHIARWNGAFWAPLVGGIDGIVNALAVYDDGGGPALYAAGDFQT